MPNYALMYLNFYYYFSRRFCRINVSPTVSPVHGNKETNSQYIPEAKLSAKLKGMCQRIKYWISAKRSCSLTRSCVNSSTNPMAHTSHSKKQLKQQKIPITKSNFWNFRANIVPSLEFASRTCKKPPQRKQTALKKIIYYPVSQFSIQLSVSGIYVRYYTLIIFLVMLYCRIYLNGSGSTSLATSKQQLSYWRHVRGDPRTIPIIGTLLLEWLCKEEWM